MNTSELLSELRRLDVRVEARGDRLVFNAPSGILTPEWREKLQSRKQEILDFLASAQALARQQPAIVPLNARGTRVPIFAVPGHNGDVFCYRAFSAQLGPDQPLYGLQPPGLDGASQPLEQVPELAAYFARQVRATRPEGPVIIVGFCAGGGIALELACQLRESGVPVALLAVFGSPFPKAYRFWSMTRIRLLNAWRRLGVHARAAFDGSSGGVLRYASERIRSVRAAHARQREEHAQVVADPVLALRRKVEDTTLRALVAYEPRRFEGRGVQFVPNAQWRAIGDFGRPWRRVMGEYSEFEGPESCTGENILLEPHVQRTAAEFEARRQA